MGKKKQEKSTVEPVEGHNSYITAKRKCTDMICLVLFIIFWVGMIAVATVGFASGQPEKLVFGTDWQGRTCGAKASKSGEIPAYDLKSYPYILYPRLSDDLLEMQLEVAAGKSTKESYKKFFGICVKECPKPKNLQDQTLYAHAFKDYSIDSEPINTVNTSAGANEYTDSGSPWRIALNTSNVFYRCLDLGEVDKESYVRCVDPCPGGSTTNCGTSLTTNPFNKCGKSGCDKYLENNIPKCKTAETKEEIITKSAAKKSPLYDQLNSNFALISRWLGDVEKAAVPILLSGGLFAIIVGMVWIFLLRCSAGIFTWLSIFLVLVMLFSATLFAAFRGELIEASHISSAFEAAGINADVATDVHTYVNTAGFKTNEENIKYWAICAYFGIFVNLVTVLFLCAMFGRIRIAIGIIRESSKALSSMPSMVLFPLIPTAAMLTLIVYWVVTAAYIGTSGKITLKTAAAVVSSTPTSQTNGTVRFAEYDDTNLTNYMLMYHLFGLLWTNQFLQAFTYMVIAGAVSEYYWTLDKRSIPRLPVFRSFYRVLRYHLGTIAFGSLIIAIVQMVRVIMEYIDRQTRQAQQSNKLVKAAMCCCKCCLWCFEQILKFLNKNAYIVSAMKGTSFCTSMRTAFKLIFANIARVATVGIISTFLLLLGKLFIVGLSCLCLAAFMYKPPENMPTLFMGDLNEISSPIFPFIVCAILSFAIATFCLDVYQTTIDTILLCFCEDCDVNKASGTYYMSDELLSFIDSSAAKQRKKERKNSKK